VKRFESKNVKTFCLASVSVCVCVCVCVRARVFGLPIVEKIIPEIAEGERNELEKAERIQVVHK
jgi:hypothetical protein